MKGDKVLVNRNIVVIGHDNRISIVHNMLVAEGYNVLYANRKDEMPCIKSSDIIILPIPYKDATGKIKGTELFMSDIAPKLNSTNIVILGKADGAFADIAARIGFEYIDINEDRRFKILNAIPTAEAAVSIAMEHSAYTLFGQHVLVCGYGCIAKCLVKLLNAFGCTVTVAARKQADLYEAEYFGCKTVRIEKLADIVAEQNIIFNTCPALVLNKQALQNVSSRCIIIDLASRPGGCDFDFARENNINAKLYLSLPDIYAPQNAGENMYKIIASIIERHGLQKT